LQKHALLDEARARLEDKAAKSDDTEVPVYFFKNEDF